MAGGRFEVTLALLATVALALVALHHGGGSAELESAAADREGVATLACHCRCTVTHNRETHTCVTQTHAAHIHMLSPFSWCPAMISDC